MKKIFIDGSEGTTGLRIFERFEKRNDIELLKIDSELRKDPDEIKKFINMSDITFLCLPDQAAREAVALVENPDVVIIDTSTAHRTEAGWTYGFPELSASQREAIKTSKRIAVPGCHASGVISIIYPLVKAGLLSKDSLLSCFSISGYSGAGKKGIAQYEDKDRSYLFDAPRQYGLTQMHKHIKEIQTLCELENAPVFSPIVCDYYSGMEVTMPIHLKSFTKKITLSEIRDFYKDYYKNQTFVKVQDEGYELQENNFYSANALTGKDYMEIMVNGNEDRCIIVSRFDNLGKGASGAAIQCMNISMGIDEATGLEL